ncbi:MAG: PEGA domain-containing protein [Myxococcales bacterium]|nr:PEGA domain-containing protein [Myxococcales bacterium]
MVRFLFFAWACLVLAGAPRVSAQTEDERAQARAAFQRGVEAYGGERFEEALRAFQEAYRVAPHPSVRVNMANCYERLSRPIEALDHFERFLVEAEGASDEQKREVRSAIRRLRQQVGEVFFRVQPEGATLRIDGNTTRTAPVLEAVELARGTHELEVTLDGYQTSTRSFEVRGGDRVELNVTLEESLEPVAPVAEPLDVPAEPDPIAASLQEPVEEEDDDGGSRLSTPFFIAGAATVALLGTTVGLGVAALGAESDFDDAVIRSNGAPTAAEREAARQDGLDADQKATRLALATDILAVGTVLAAGATIFFLLWHPDDEDTATTQVAPLAGPNAGGLIVRRSF